MNPDDLLKLLRRVRSGTLAPAAALQQLRHLPYENLGFARTDNHRALRQGFPEVIFCEGKTAEQVGAIAARILERHGTLLATRASRRCMKLSEPMRPGRSIIR